MAERLLLTVEEASEALALSRTTLYQLLATGVIARVKVGRSTRIPIDGLRRFVNERAATAANGDGSREAEHGRLRSG